MSTDTHGSGPDCERYADAIDALADNDIDTGDTVVTPTRQPVEVHLAECAPCRSLLTDLRQIRVLAGTLQSAEPPAHIWHDLRRRAAVDTPVPGDAAPSWSWSQWSPRERWLRGAALVAATGVVLAVLVPNIFRGPAPTPVPLSTNVSTSSVARTASAEPDPVERHYLETIGELERVAAGNQTGVTPVRATLTQSLAMIDSAIAQSRSAVAEEPNSAVARSHLRAGLRRKVTVLQTLVATANHVRSNSP